MIKECMHFVLTNNQFLPQQKNRKLTIIRIEPKIVDSYSLRGKWEKPQFSIETLNKKNCRGRIDMNFFHLIYNRLFNICANFQLYANY